MSGNILELRRFSLLQSLRSAVIGQAYTSPVSLAWHSRLCFLLWCSYKKSETCVNLIELKSVSRQGIMPQLPQYHSNGCLRQKIKFSHSTFKDKAEILIQPCARYCLYFTLSPELDTADNSSMCNPYLSGLVALRELILTGRTCQNPLLPGHSATMDRKRHLKKLHAFNYLQNPAGKRD